MIVIERMDKIPLFAVANKNYIFVEIITLLTI